MAKKSNSLSPETMMECYTTQTTSLRIHSGHDKCGKQSSRHHLHALKADDIPKEGLTSKTKLHPQVHQGAH